MSCSIASYNYTAVDLPTYNITVKILSVFTYDYVSNYLTKPDDFRLFHAHSIDNHLDLLSQTLTNISKQLTNKEITYVSMLLC